MCEIDYDKIIEILKVSTPIVALVAMFLTPRFTANFNKEQKIRDELFSAKVKSYTTLAKIVTESIRGLEQVRSEYHRKIESDKFYQIYVDFKNAIAEQAIFTSPNTKKDIDALFTSFHKIYDNELLGEDFQKLIPFYTESIYECKQFILKLQNDIGFTKLNYLSNPTK
ncbi:hypothetical protein [Chryseobacterium indologenes]|uniref:hypothetical protein n=1 Tax=Chryseobacterium indologenes TaxID=253 RepID=UPI00301B570B